MLLGLKTFFSWFLKRPKLLIGIVLAILLYFSHDWVYELGEKAEKAKWEEQQKEQVKDNNEINSQLNDIDESKVSELQSQVKELKLKLLEKPEAEVIYVQESGNVDCFDNDGVRLLNKNFE